MTADYEPMPGQPDGFSFWDDGESPLPLLPSDLPSLLFRKMWNSRPEDTFAGMDEESGRHCLTYPSREAAMEHLRRSMPNEIPLRQLDEMTEDEQRIAAEAQAVRADPPAVLVDGTTIADLRANSEKFTITDPLKFHSLVVPDSCCIIEGAGTENVVIIALPGYRLEPIGVGRVKVVRDDHDQPAVVPAT